MCVDDCMRGFQWREINHFGESLSLDKRNPRVILGLDCRAVKALEIPIGVLA